MLSLEDGKNLVSGILSNLAREVFERRSIDLFKEIEPMDSDYIVQIDIDPVAKGNEYDFTTEKEICYTDTTDSESEQADDRNAFDIFDE